MNNEDTLSSLQIDKMDSSEAKNTEQVIGTLEFFIFRRLFCFILLGFLQKS